MTGHSTARAPAPSNGENSGRFLNAPNVISTSGKSSCVGDNDTLADEALANDAPETPFSKRTLDILGSIVLLVFFTPLMVVIFLVVRMDGGPAMFIHERVGKNGVLFRCYKFRSMILNAETVLKDILVCDSQFRKDWESDQKLRNDPRITRIGAFLRHKSLDELPQLINVLKGDMSLVGPRPITVDEVRRYGPAIEYYYQIRPGLTGSWQVSGRNNVSYEERVALDVAYSKRWSFLTDLTILLKTVGVVLSGRGAL
jgi:undecaprenyl-phosphate galactose phosphotransferase